MQEQKPRPVERHSFEVEDVTKRNSDGSHRQDVIARCEVGELILLTRGEKDVPSQDREIGVCRKKDGHQIGVLRGATAARLARPENYEFVDGIISGISQCPRLLSRKPRLMVSIEVLLYELGSVPERALGDRRFEKMVFHYRPDKEQNAVLMQMVAADLSTVIERQNGDAPDHETLKKHYALDRLLRHYYTRKEDDPSGLTKAIIACQMQIALAPESKVAFAATAPKTPLPEHAGYELLCVVREKQRMYEEVIALAEEALSQGWEHNWKVRIERCKKKLEKRDARWQEQQK
ncbi:MAG: hypothetical protein GC168_18425 [Candidatus Hydrogenedens sp.]|nr:hypothetical protein [Candidatus Hydrogenedens sp.]